MLKGIVQALAAALLLLAPAACHYSAPTEGSYLTREALKGMLADPQVLIIDVRTPKDWNESSKKIKGAVRQDPDKVAAWGKTLPPEKKIVLYCA
jgi:hypothetical protein